MEFSTVCRTCLSVENLCPIFMNVEEDKVYSDAIFMITGVTIESTDSLPQNMCKNCIEFINKSLEFRLTCKKSENKLKEFIRIAKTSKESSGIVIEKKKEVFHTEIVVENAVKDESITTEVIANKTDSDETFMKTEYLDYEVLEEDSDCDKPLKFLIENDDNKHDIDALELKVEDPDPPYVPKSDPDGIPSRTQRVSCKFCQKNLSIRSIDAHIQKRHPGADGRKTKCELCDKYIIKQLLSRHMSSSHGTSSRTFRCVYCKTEYDDKDLLKQHAPKCTAKIKKRKPCDSSREMTECEICHKTMQRASLKMHKAIKHAGLGPVCEHCGRRFSNKFRLSEHCRAKHGYDKFKCTYCDFQSASNLALQNHIRRHLGEKPFKCEECGADFHAAYLLTQHKQSHRTHRLVKCDQCPARFKANNTLHCHKLSCHARAPFECGECGRTYRGRLYALRHYRTVHGNSGEAPRIHKLPVVNTE